MNSSSAAFKEHETSRGEKLRMVMLEQRDVTNVDSNCSTRYAGSLRHSILTQPKMSEPETPTDTSRGLRMREAFESAKLQRVLAEENVMPYNRGLREGAEVLTKPCPNCRQGRLPENVYLRKCNPI